ncbi:Bug family tripartite tricarboxylate transporter substrate binding protein [Roseomonas chloroacetimidivorans]|uniref:Bug family tripartite tricarboxylate transporter substrate binding protein n=1 Tax=Roseomonas chloroacetimidivorans TaxID=1766656 RepID=UPI003C77E716
MRCNRRSAMWIAAGSLLARRALAAEPFPSRPLRFVIPYPPGGAADTIGRVVAQHASATLGQPIVVENRPGANGMIGANAALQAPADGYTLVLVTDGMYAINPHLLRPGSPDPVERLVPVIQLVTGPLVIVGRPDLPATNLPELIALAKSRPGELTYGANNVTSSHYLISRLLMQAAGIEMSHVAYAGPTAAMPDLLGGRLDLLISGPAGTDLRPSSRLRRIAVTSAARLPDHPDIPAVAETLPGFNHAFAFGIMVQAGTPPEAVAALNRAFDAALAEVPVREKIATAGALTMGGPPDRFATSIERQKRTMAGIIANLGLKPE